MPPDPLSLSMLPHTRLSIYKINPCWASIDTAYIIIIIELVDYKLCRDGPDMLYIHVHMHAYINALQSIINSEQLKCLTLWSICQNIYLSIPFTSIRYACLNELFLKLKKKHCQSFFLISRTNSRLHGPLMITSYKSIPFCSMLVHGMLVLCYDSYIMVGLVSAFYYWVGAKSTFVG